MNIKFKHITIENFLSLGHIDLDLDSRGYVLVSGVNKATTDSASSNGSGKSSLWEALVYGLTGDTIRGITKVTNVNAKDGALVDISFDVDGVPYRILRAKDHSVWKTAVKLWINGEDKSGKGIRETEKIIADYLPDLSPQIIGSVIVLGQGLPQRFTNNTPAGRKEVLEKLTKSDYMIEDLKNKISSRRAQLSDEINALDIESATLNGQIKSIDEHIAEAQSIIDDIQNVTSLKEELDSVEAELAVRQDEFNEASSNVDKWTKVVNDYKTQIVEAKSAFTLQLSEIDKEWLQLPISAEIIKLEGEEKHLKAERERIASLGDVCPTCGQPVPEEYKGEVMSYDLELEELGTKLEKLRKEKQRLEEEKNKKRVALREESIKQIDAIDANCKAAFQRYTEYSEKRSQLGKDITEITTSCNEVRSRYDRAVSLQQNAQDVIGSLNAKKEELNNAILYKEVESHKKSEHLAILSKFNASVTREFRGYLLSGIIDYIDKTAKKYALSAFGSENISFELDKNNIAVKYNDKDYESLSGGEKQKIDVIIQLALRNVLCNFLRFSTNIIVLDEVFDNLDVVGCQQVIDLMTNELRDVSSVYIVTHHASDLSIPYDEEIVVVKNTAGISEI